MVLHGEEYEEGKLIKEEKDKSHYVFDPIDIYLTLWGGQGHMIKMKNLYARYYDNQKVYWFHKLSIILNLITNWTNILNVKLILVVCIITLLSRILKYSFASN